MALHIEGSGYVNLNALVVIGCVEPAIAAGMAWTEGRGRS